MSVTAQTPYKKYVAAPGATLFTTDFRLLLATDLQVKVNNAVITSGFTLGTLGGASTDLTFTTPMVGGEIVELQRKVPKTRATDYQQLGDYQASQVNSDFDRIVMMIQDAQFLNDLAVLLPVGDTAAPMVLPAVVARALKFLAFDADGKAIAAAGVTGSPVSAFMAAVILAADEAAARSGIGAAAAGANNDITALGALESVPSVIASSITRVPIRQTVLSGPVDTNGLPNFGGSTGSTTVTASGTLVATAANGFGASGQVDRVGSITNPSWTGLSTNGTMYLYLDIAANGTCTTGSTTLAPTYRWGGADVTTNNQFAFNIQEMVGKVGNGSTAVQTYRVFVGEVTVAGGVVTAITWYALMGRYRSANVATLPSATAGLHLSHNIGCEPQVEAMKIVCTSADGSFAVGDVYKATGALWTNGSTAVSPQPYVSRLLWSLGVWSGATGWQLILRTNGVVTSLTPAKWSYYVEVERGW